MERKTPKKKNKIKKKKKKKIFTPLKKEEDRILWTMKCYKKSKMFSSDHV